MPWQSLAVELQQQILCAAAEEEIWCDDREANVPGQLARNRTLATLRTVCRDWNEFATPLLFRHPVLRKEKNVGALLDLLGDRTTRRRLAPLVQHITVKAELCSDLLLPDLSFFPALTSLDGLVWPFDEEDVVGPRPLRGVQLAHLGVDLYHAADDFTITSPPFALANLVSFTVDCSPWQAMDVLNRVLLRSLPALRHLCMHFGQAEDSDAAWQLAFGALEHFGKQLETFQMLMDDVRGENDPNPPVGLLDRLDNVRRVTLPDDRALRHPYPALPRLRRLYLVQGAPRHPAADDAEDLGRWSLEKDGVVFGLLSSPGPLAPTATDALPSLREIGFQRIDFRRPGDVASPSVRLAAVNLKAKGITLLDRCGRPHPDV